MIGLRFLLQGGQFFQAVLSQREAQEIITNWMTGTYALKGKTTIGSMDFPSAYGGIWAVRLDTIVGIHTMEMEQATKFPTPTQQVWKNSGLN